MIIIIDNRYFIHPECIGSVQDNRADAHEKGIRVYTLEGNISYLLEGDQADQFMTQYLMFANNRNRQFELGYGQILAYYTQMEAHVAARQADAQTQEDKAAADTLEGWLAPGTDKGQ